MCQMEIWAGCSNPYGLGRSVQAKSGGNKQENSSQPITHYEGKVQNLEKKNMASFRGSSPINDECCVASAWKKDVLAKKKKNRRRRRRSVKTPCSIYQCTWIITTLFRGPFFQCLTHTHTKDVWPKLLPQSSMGLVSPLNCKRCKNPSMDVWSSNIWLGCFFVLWFLSSQVFLCNCVLLLKGVSFGAYQVPCQNDLPTNSAPGDGVKVQSEASHFL